tara:strand:- start:1182 stop:1709 length:528 start_codon:yes stop_codon:yes gene_type:complete
MIKSELMNLFLKEAEKKLEGEFILIGGALLPALGIETRVTTDIDIIRVKETSDHQYLMHAFKIAEKLGFPPEAINFAAEFFFQKQKAKKNELILFYKKGKFILYRPSCFLYFRLKVVRLSPSDLIDCKNYLKWCFENSELKEIQKIINYLESQLGKKEHLTERLFSLIEMLKSYA